MAKKKGNPNPKPLPSRGVPAAESLWMPKHYGREIRGKGGLEEGVIWGISEITDFIFPKKYQPTYHKVASDFIHLLLKNEKVTKNEITQFITENKYSRSTLENKVIPKLVKFGLIKREREIEGRLGKGRSLILTDSLTFTNYLKKIGGAWKTQVLTARHKRRKT